MMSYSFYLLIEFSVPLVELSIALLNSPIAPLRFEKENHMKI